MSGLGGFTRRPSLDFSVSSNLTVSTSSASVRPSPSSFSPAPSSQRPFTTSNVNGAKSAMLSRSMSDVGLDSRPNNNARRTDNTLPPRSSSSSRLKSASNIPLSRNAPSPSSAPGTSRPSSRGLPSPSYLSSLLDEYTDPTQLKTSIGTDAYKTVELLERPAAVKLNVDIFDTQELSGLQYLLKPTTAGRRREAEEVIDPWRGLFNTTAPQSSSATANLQYPLYHSSSSAPYFLAAPHSSALSLGTPSQSFRKQYDPPNSLAASAATVTEKTKKLDEDFVKEYKKRSRVANAIRRLQCWWRMTRHVRRLRRWKSRRTLFKGQHFRCWATITQAEAKFRNMCKGHAFRMWRDLYKDAKHTKYCSRIIFEKSITSGRLTIPSVNLFFQRDFSLFDGLKDMDLVRYESVLVGIRRQILTILFKSWKARSKAAERGRANARDKLMSALRKCPSYGTWAGELANLGFHMWRRAVCHRKDWKKIEREGGSMRIFNNPHLVEWDEWVERFDERRRLKAFVAKQGVLMFIKNKFRRWRKYSSCLAAENARLDFAARYYNGAKLRLILRKWSLFCKGRGRAYRRRIVYLQAWAEWAPRKRRLRELKIRAASKVQEVRMRCILRNWCQRVQNALLVYAYGNHRLLDASNNAKQAIMASAYIWSGRITNYVVLTCWKKWARYSKRVRRWKSFKFWCLSTHARHLLFVCFKGWFFQTGKNWKPVADKLSLEPHSFIDRGRLMLANIDAGYDISGSISEKTISRSLDVGFDVPSAFELDAKPRNSPKKAAEIKAHAAAAKAASPTKGGAQRMSVAMSALASVSLAASASVASSTDGDHYAVPTAHDKQREKRLAKARAQELLFLRAIISCDLLAVNSFLKMGVSANAISDDGTGRTALHLAAEHTSADYFPVVVALLRCGASTHAPDNRGKLPIDLTVNPHVAGLIYSHMKRVEKADYSHSERRRVMEVMTEKSSRVGTRMIWRFVVCNLLNSKIKEVKLSLSKLPIDMGKIQSASADDSKNIDDVLEDFAADAGSNMDDIVKGVMHFRMHLRFGSIMKLAESQQRSSDPSDTGLVDLIHEHFTTVSHLYFTESDVAANKKPDKHAVPEKQDKHSKHGRHPEDESDGENSDEPSVVHYNDTDAVGDVKFVGIEHVRRRQKFAALWCMQWSQTHSTALIPSKGKLQNRKQAGGGNRLRESVAHRALLQIISGQEKNIVDALAVQSARIQRDDTLMQNAFLREIRADYKRLHPDKFFGDAPSKASTGDLAQALRRKKELQGAGALAVGDVAAQFSSTEKPKPLVEDFKLRLKTEPKGSIGTITAVAYDSSGLIMVTPNVRQVSLAEGVGKLRRLGEDHNIDKFVDRLVDSVRFSNLIDGFVALGNDAAAGEKQSSLDDQDMLPNGWWDRDRAYTALLEEATSLHQRRLNYDAKTKELLKKSNALTEAINVVTDSAYETGTELRELKDRRAVVDSTNVVQMQQAKGSIRRLEKAIADNAVAVVRTEAEIARLKILFRKKLEIEEQEEKAAAEAIAKAAATPGKKNKKDAAIDKKTSAPPNKKKKDGDLSEVKTDEELTADDVMGMQSNAEKILSSLLAKGVGAQEALRKARLQFENSEWSKYNSYTVMVETVQSDLATMTQLHLSIADYEQEKAKVDAERHELMTHMNSINTQIEDVVYTAKLIAPPDAKPFEYKVKAMLLKENCPDKSEKADSRHIQASPAVVDFDASSGQHLSVGGTTAASVQNLAYRSDGSIAADFPESSIVKSIVASQHSAAKIQSSSMGGVLADGDFSSPAGAPESMLLTNDVQLLSVAAVIDPIVAPASEQRGRNDSAVSLSTFDSGRGGDDEEDSLHPPTIRSDSVGHAEKVAAGSGSVASFSIESIEAHDTGSDSDEEAAGDDSNIEGIQFKGALALDVSESVGIDDNGEDEESSSSDGGDSPKDDDDVDEIQLESKPVGAPSALFDYSRKAEEEQNASTQDYFQKKPVKSTHLTQEQLEMQEVYDHALAMLFKKERERHRKAEKDEAVRKMKAEEALKEAAEQRSQETLDTFSKDSSRVQTPISPKRTPRKMSPRPGSTVPSPKPGQLVRRVSSLKADLQKISKATDNSEKKYASDEQFYQERDCHTMRKFMRKREEKVHEVAKNEKSSKKNRASLSGRFGDTEDIENDASVTSVVEEYLYANIGKIGLSTSDDDYDAGNADRLLDCDGLLAGGDMDAALRSWKSSIHTPFLDQSTLSSVPDTDTRKMNNNLGLSVSMKDEHQTTDLVMNTIGAVRRNRVNVEAVRLKSEDQFMFIGQSKNVKVGVSNEDSRFPAPRGYSGDVLGEFEDDNMLEGNASLAQQSENINRPGEELNGDVDAPIDDPAHSSRSPVLKLSSSAFPLANDGFDQPAVKVAADNTDNLVLYQSQSAPEIPGHLEPSRSSLRNTPQTAMRTLSTTGGSPQAKIRSLENSRNSTPIVSARNLVSVAAADSGESMIDPLSATSEEVRYADPDMISMYQWYPLLLTAGAETAALNMTHIPKQREISADSIAGVSVIGVPPTVALKGTQTVVSTQRQNKLLVVGQQSKLSLHEPRSGGIQSPDSVVSVLSTGVLSTGEVAEVPSIISASVSILSVPQAASGTKSTGSAMVNSTASSGVVIAGRNIDVDEDCYDDNASVESVVSSIITLLDKKIGILTQPLVAPAPEKKGPIGSEMSPKKITGALFHGKAGIAGKTILGGDMLPAADLNPRQQHKKMALTSKTSHHIGQKTVWPKNPADTSFLRPKSSAALANSRTGTASTWNTSSRPTSGFFSGRLSAARNYEGSRPTSGQIMPDIRISESSGIRIVRSQDGVEYNYSIYDRSNNPSRGDMGAVTPAALPTQMLFDETGKVYGEILTFNDGLPTEMPAEGLLGIETEDDAKREPRQQAPSVSVDGTNALLVSGKRIGMDSESSGAAAPQGQDRIPAEVESIPLPPLSKSEKVEAWRNFEKRKMSEATLAAYTLLLEEKSGLKIKLSAGGPASIQKEAIGDLLGDQLVADIERLRVEGPAFVFEEDTKLFGENLVVEVAEGENDGGEVWAASPRPNSPLNLQTNVDETINGLAGDRDTNSAGGIGLVGFYNNHLNSHHSSSIGNEVALQAALKKLNEHLEASEVEKAYVKYQAVATRRRLEEAIIEAKRNAVTSPPGAAALFDSVKSSRRNSTSDDVSREKLAITGVARPAPPLALYVKPQSAEERRSSARSRSGSASDGTKRRVLRKAEDGKVRLGGPIRVPSPTNDCDDDKTSNRGVFNLEAGVSDSYINLGAAEFEGSYSMADAQQLWAAEGSLFSDEEGGNGAASPVEHSDVANFPSFSGSIEQQTFYVGESVASLGSAETKTLTGSERDALAGVTSEQIHNWSAFNRTSSSPAALGESDAGVPHLTEPPLAVPKSPPKKNVSISPRIIVSSATFVGDNQGMLFDEDIGEKPKTPLTDSASYVPKTPEIVSTLASLSPLGGRSGQWLKEDSAEVWTLEHDDMRDPNVGKEPTGEVDDLIAGALGSIGPVLDRGTSRGPKKSTGAPRGNRRSVGKEKDREGKKSMASPLKGDVVKKSDGKSDDKNRRTKDEAVRVDRRSVSQKEKEGKKPSPKEAAVVDLSRVGKVANEKASVVALDRRYGDGDQVPQAPSIQRNSEAEKEKEEKEVERKKEVESAAADTAAAAAAVKSKIIRVKSAASAQWNAYSKKKELEDLRQAEVRKFVFDTQMKKAEKAKQKKKDALLTGETAVSIDSNSTTASMIEKLAATKLWEADDDSEEEVFVKDFKAQAKSVPYVDFHVDEGRSAKKYFDRRRGPEVREKVKDEAYLLWEKRLEEQLSERPTLADGGKSILTPHDFDEESSVGSI